jgi:hypothetical protein
MNKLTAEQQSVLDTRGCAIEDHGQLGRLLINSGSSGHASEGDRLDIRRNCRNALAAAGHDVGDLRIGIFGPFPGH